MVGTPSSERLDVAQLEQNAAAGPFAAGLFAGLAGKDDDQILADLVEGLDQRRSRSRCRRTSSNISDATPHVTLDMVSSERSR